MLGGGGAVFSSTKGGSEVVMTIKNYKTPGGLSRRIFDETQDGRNIVLTC